MADNEALATALAAIEALPIVTAGTAKPLNTTKDGITARLTCPPSCTSPRYSVQRQLSATNNTLPKCAASLLELLKKDHASCIAEAQASADTAAAADAFDNSFLGALMTNAQVKAHAERLAEQIKQAKSALEKARVHAEACEVHAETARRAEEEAAAPFVQPRIEAEQVAAAAAALAVHIHTV